MKKRKLETAYPLTWPDHVPRHKAHQRGRSAFKTTVAKALDNVNNSLRLLGENSGKPVKNVVISSDYALGDTNPDDPGVAVYFTWDDVRTCIPVDRYDKLCDNLQAIHHVIDADRTKLRHSGIHLIRAAFRGYAALPPPEEGNARPWHIVLKIPEDAPAALVEKQYKKMRSDYHPDRPNGDAAMFDEITKAYQEYKAAS